MAENQSDIPKHRHAITAIVFGLLGFSSWLLFVGLELFSQHLLLRITGWLLLAILSIRALQEVAQVVPEDRARRLAITFTDYLGTAVGAIVVIPFYIFKTVGSLFIAVAFLVIFQMLIWKAIGLAFAGNGSSLLQNKAVIFVITTTTTVLVAHGKPILSTLAKYSHFASRHEDWHDDIVELPR